MGFKIVTFLVFVVSAQSQLLMYVIGAPLNTQSEAQIDMIQGTDMRSVDYVQPAAVIATPARATVIAETDDVRTVDYIHPAVIATPARATVVSQTPFNVASGSMGVPVVATHPLLNAGAAAVPTYISRSLSSPYSYTI